MMIANDDMLALFHCLFILLIIFLIGYIFSAIYYNIHSMNLVKDVKFNTHALNIMSNELYKLKHANSKKTIQFLIHEDYVKQHHYLGYYYEITTKYMVEKNDKLSEFYIFTKIGDKVVKIENDTYLVQPFKMPKHISPGWIKY